MLETYVIWTCCDGIFSNWNKEKTCSNSEIRIWIYFIREQCSVCMMVNLAVILSWLWWQISDLTSSLQSNWPTLACPSGDGMTFWSHEWSKHGTCSESVLKQHDYFEAALSLRKKANLLQALTSAGTCLGFFVTIFSINSTSSSVLEIQAELIMDIFFTFWKLWFYIYNISLIYTMHLTPLLTQNFTTMDLWVFHI